MCDPPKSLDSQLGTNWRALNSRLKTNTGKRVRTTQQPELENITGILGLHIKKDVQLLGTARQCTLKYIIFLVTVPKGRLRRNVGNRYSVLRITALSMLALSYDTNIQDTFRRISYNNCKHAGVLAKRVVTSSTGHINRLRSCRYN